MSFSAIRIFIPGIVNPDNCKELYEQVKDEDINIYLCNSLEEVVNTANEVSVSGEVVLFSPASASFDMFKNAYQRGDLFKSLVEKI